MSNGRVACTFVGMARRRQPNSLERIARGYAAYAVGRVAYGLLLIALISVVSILAIVVFGLLAVVYVGLFTILGEPGPPLGPILAVGWFVGSLLAVFLILVRGYRWLEKLIHIADAPAAWLDPTPDEQDVADEPHGEP